MTDTRNAIQKRAAEVSGGDWWWWPRTPAATDMSKAHYYPQGEKRALCGVRKNAMAYRLSQDEYHEKCSRCEGKL